MAAAMAVVMVEVTATLAVLVASLGGRLPVNARTTGDLPDTLDVLTVAFLSYSMLHRSTHTACITFGWLSSLSFGTRFFGISNGGDHDCIISNGASRTRPQGPFTALTIDSGLPVLQYRRTHSTT
jgi:hypothetical protein